MSAREAEKPLNGTQFAELMAALAPPAHLALAVSGGGDSMALLCLAAAWQGVRLQQMPSASMVVLTVAHGLRKEATQEIALVAETAKRLGLAHHVLTWEGEKPTKGVQAAAREARYELMRTWCARHGCDAILLAHTRDDQVETVLMRLERGSGLDGLAGMAPRQNLFGLEVLRPLLPVSRAALRATLRERKQNWAEDESNDDPRFTRTRFRKMIPGLAAAGVSVDRILALSKEAGQLRSVLEVRTVEALRLAATRYEAGFYAFQADRLLALPRPIALRALKAVLAGTGGARWPASSDSLERLYDALGDWCHGDPESLGGGRTLGGCKIVPRSRRRLFILRETGRVAPSPVKLGAGEHLRWDRRFDVYLPLTGKGAASAGGWVGMLGEDYILIPRENYSLDLPQSVRRTLPALRSDDGVLLSAPQLGYIAPQARGTPAEGFQALFRPQNRLLQEAAGT
jgi:tRNA(Ile)-lysidine synthase